MKRTHLLSCFCLLLLLLTGCKKTEVIPEEPAPTYARQHTGNWIYAYQWSYGMEGNEWFQDLQVNESGEVFLIMNDNLNGIQILKTEATGAPLWRKRYLEGGFTTSSNYLPFMPESTSLLLDENGHIWVGGGRLAPSVDLQSSDFVGNIVELDGEGIYLNETLIRESNGFASNGISSIGMTANGELVYGGSRFISGSSGPNDPGRDIFVNEHYFRTAESNRYHSTLSELKVDAAGVIHTVGLGGIKGEELHLLETNKAGDLLYSQSWSDWRTGTYDLWGPCFVEPLANGKTLLGGIGITGTLVALLDASGNYESHDFMAGLALYSAAECPNGDFIFSGSEQYRPYLIRTTSSFGTVWGKTYTDFPEGELYRIRNHPKGGFVACGYTRDSSTASARWDGLLIRTDANGN